jgi:hypothetical protein
MAWTDATFAADAVYHGLIRQLYPLGDGTYVLVFNPSPDLPVCIGSVGYRYMYIRGGQNGVTADGLKNIVATSLLGFAMERAIDVVYDNGSSSCFVNRISLE